MITQAVFRIIIHALLQRTTQETSPCCTRNMPSAKVVYPFTSWAGTSSMPVSQTFCPPHLWGGQPHLIPGQSHLIPWPVPLNKLKKQVLSWTASHTSQPRLNYPSPSMTELQGQVTVHQWLHHALLLSGIPCISDPHHVYNMHCSTVCG